MINVTLICSSQITTNSHALLATARSKEYAKSGEETLLQLFCCSHRKDKLALAKLQAHGEDLTAQQGWWLKVDPVELCVDGGQIYMLGSQHLNLKEQEKAFLSKQLKDYFSDYHMEFFSPTLSEWYICSQKPLSITTSHLWQVIGKDIREFLPRGEEQKFWRLLLTEIQMLLFNNKMNEERQKLGLPLINSVWFSGEGDLLPNCCPSVWQKTWGVSSLQKGLAKYYAVPIHSYAENFPSCYAQMQPGGNYLIVLGEEEQLRLNQNWFDPFWDALRLQQIASVNLYIPKFRHFVIKSKQVVPFWKHLVRVFSIKR